MANDEQKNTNAVDLDLDLPKSPAMNQTVSPEIPINTAPTTENTPDLNDEIKQLEENYKKEVSIKEDLQEKLEKLKGSKKEVEENITERENIIRKDIVDLKNLKERIDTELKKINLLKEADKEIDQKIKEIEELNASKKIIENEVAALEEKLRNLES